MRIWTRLLRGKVAGFLLVGLTILLPFAGLFTPRELGLAQAAGTGAPSRAAERKAVPPGGSVALTVNRALAFQIQNPYAGPGEFRKAQFHLHTANSFDGDKQFPPDATALAFKRAGYSFIIFTDHDVISSSTIHNDETFLAASGYESTGNNGHIGAWFVSQVLDAHLPPEYRVAATVAAGGIASANHPDYVVGFSADQLQQMTGYRCVEIFNHITSKTPQQVAQNIEKWRQAINARGAEQPVWAIAVSDTHAGFTGGGWTSVKTTTVSLPALRAAIERGSMYATNGPELGAIDVVDGQIVVDGTSSPLPIRQIRFIDQDGNVLRVVAADQAAYRPTGAEQWVRIEASDSAGHTAWTQPLWITTLASFSQVPGVQP